MRETPMNEKRIHYKSQYFLGKVGYLFRPATVIIVCLTVMIVLNAILFTLTIAAKSEYFRDVAIALMTGVTASTVVAIFIEMANNFRRNNKDGLCCQNYLVC
jgi:hypothetical protein